MVKIKAARLVLMMAPLGKACQLWQMPIGATGFAAVIGRASSVHEDSCVRSVTFPWRIQPSMPSVATTATSVAIEGFIVFSLREGGRNLRRNVVPARRLGLPKCPEP
jgi:hypothetical protein